VSETDTGICVDPALYCHLPRSVVSSEKRKIKLGGNKGGNVVGWRFGWWHGIKARCCWVL